MNEPTREIFGNLPAWMQVTFYAVAAAASLLLLYGLARRVMKLKQGRAEARFDRLGARLLGAAKQILSGRAVREGDRLAGAAHELILWGFLVLLLGTTLVAIDHDILRHFGVKMLQGPFYLGFSLFLDVFGVLFLAGLGIMLWRREKLRPRKLDYRRPDEGAVEVDRRPYVLDDRIFLWLLLLIGVTGFLVEGLRIAENLPGFERWSPVGYSIALALQGFSEAALGDAHRFAWWLHAVLVMGFLAYIPFSKMLHMFADAANLVFRDPLAGRALPPPPARDAKGEATPAMGYARITDFTWKELLDFDACTKCGRCHDACPARAAGTTLSPRDLILDLRTFANEAFGTREWLSQRFPAGGWGGQGDLREREIAGAVIARDALWSCTTCLACVEACPVGIEHITSIVQMRRRLVDRGEIDDNLQGALVSLGDYGNSFGESKKKRARWTKGLSFKLKDARKEEVDVLWFVGDFASYDPRIQKNTRRVAEVLHRAGVDFGILYDAERNAGNDVRRVGEEGLFEMLAEENVEAMKKASFRRVVTTDPHSLNALRHDYKAFGLDVEVVHYTRLLHERIEAGHIEFSRRIGARVTYHDPCYLARYNGEVDAPRAVLRAVGAELVDMPRCGKNTFCCGAGGGRIWMDTSNETKRTSEQRIEEALALGGIDVFVTACPKDYAMYGDAVKSLGKEGEIVVRDIIELVEEALAPEGEAAVEQAS